MVATTSSDKLVHIDGLGFGDDEPGTGYLDEGIDEAVHGLGTDVDDAEGLGALSSKMWSSCLRVFSEMYSDASNSWTLVQSSFEMSLKPRILTQRRTEVVGDDVDDGLEFLFFWVISEVAVLALSSSWS